MIQFLLSLHSQNQHVINAVLCKSVHQRTNTPPIKELELSTHMVFSLKSYNQAWWVHFPKHTKRILRQANFTSSEMPRFERDRVKNLHRAIDLCIVKVAYQKNQCTKLHIYTVDGAHLRQNSTLMDLEIYSNTGTSIQNLKVWNI